MQFVKGVEETLLSLLLAADKLDVVNQQDIGASVLIAELLCLSLLNSADKLVGELFTTSVAYPEALG